MAERLYCLFVGKSGKAAIEADLEARYFHSSWTVEGFVDKEGKIEEQSAFWEKLRAAEIENWDREYLSDGSRIEDAVSWELEYRGRNYRGEEGYWPYHYEELLDALLLLDPDIAYFDYR